MASRQHWDALKQDVKPIYTAVNAAAARAALDELAERWGKRYGGDDQVWDNAWEEFIPFLDYDVQIRTVICSTELGSSRSTPGTGGRSRRGAIFRPSRPR